MNFTASLGRRLLICLILTFVSSGIAMAEDMTCSTLDACVEETSARLKQKSEANIYISDNVVGQAFHQFNQVGFDALFNLAVSANLENREFLLSALVGMTEAHGDDPVYELAEAQYNILVDLWETAPSFTLASLINSADTPHSHAFILENLKNSNGDKRQAAERVIDYIGLGKSDTPISAEHLSGIIHRIENHEPSPALRILNRIDSPAAQDALWAMLKSKNRSIFENAFITLRERDQPRLYPALRQLTFEDTAEDRARAVMIAQVITRARRKISPAPQAYSYWKAWYDAAKPGSTERLIPAYMLFSLQEKTASKLSSSERNVKRLTRSLEEVEEGRMENMRGLTQAQWIEIFSRDLERHEIYPLLLKATTEALVENEAEVVADYFRIFDILKAQRAAYNTSSFHLPFSKVLDRVIQTDTIWLDEFSRRLDCEPAGDSYALIVQIAELDAADTRLHACLISRLEKTNDMPFLQETLALISRYDDLRVDRDIHQAVSVIDEAHPFTSIRMVRQLILSNSATPKIKGRGQVFWYADTRDALQKINANRSYCEAEAVANFNYITPPENFDAQVMSLFPRYGESLMSVKTPSGYLTGHNRGEFGGGLLYFADENSEPVSLHNRNMIAIIETEQKGIYWGLSGLNHMVPGAGVIHRIDARTDAVSIDLHKTMPLVTRDVKLLKNGELFMDFWSRNRTTYSNGVKTETPNPASDYNPPVILTRAGEIISACEG